MNAMNVFMNVAIFWVIAPCSPYARVDPEDEGDSFLRKVGSHRDYTALYPRRWQHSSSVVVLTLNRD
jgi:hypothetical protein